MAKLTIGASSGPDTAAPGQAQADALGASAESGRDIDPGADIVTQQKRQRKRDDGRGRDAPALFKGDDPTAAFGPDYGYRRIRFHKDDEVNPYAAEQDRRYGIDPRLSKIIVMAVAVAVIFILACILPTNVFSNATRSDHTIGTLAGEVAVGFQSFLAFFTDPDTMYGTYVFTVLVGLLSGAAMGLSGGVYQGAMRNALASPSTLGVMSGGTIGAIVYAVFVAPSSVGATYQGYISGYAEAVGNMDPLQYALELYGAFAASLVGCMAVVAIVMAISLVAGRGHVSNASLIIAGQVFTAVIGVVITWIREYLTLNGSQTTVRYLTDSQTSTFTGSYDVVSVAAFAIPLVLCMAVVFAMSGRLSLLAFDEDEARTMGISITRTRNVMVTLCTVLTALVVAFCGPVGFVGFMAPHVARRIVGPNFRYLLPACTLLGAIVVGIAHYVSLLGIPWIVEGSTGVITSVVGCVMFLVMALRRKESADAAWL